MPGYEETVQCPYEKSHIILKHRFQTHLIKCKRSHPDIQLEICPFDQTHHVAKNELDVSFNFNFTIIATFFSNRYNLLMQNHVKTCPSRAVFDLHVYNVSGGSRNTVAPPPKLAIPKKQELGGEENWDDVCIENAFINFEQSFIRLEIFD